MRNIIVKSEMSRDEVDSLNKEQLSELGLCLLRVRPTKRCDDCNTNKFIGYMLSDTVWINELGLKHSNSLCFSCMLKRLKRKLVADDFKNVPINECLIELV